MVSVANWSEPGDGGGKKEGGVEARDLGDTYKAFPMGRSEMSRM
jgi:hypothetical protein